MAIDVDNDGKDELLVGSTSSILASTPILYFTAGNGQILGTTKALAGLADRIPAQRWAALLESASTELLLIVTRPPQELKALLQRLNATFLHEAVDPNVRRPGLLSAVETRTPAYRRR